MKKFDAVISEIVAAHVLTPVKVEAETIEEAFSKLNSCREVLKNKIQDELDELKEKGIEVSSEDVDLINTYTVDGNQSSYVQLYSITGEDKTLYHTQDIFKKENIAYGNEHAGCYALISMQTALNANIDLRKEAVIIKPNDDDFYTISKAQLGKLNFFKGDYGIEE